MEVTQTHMKRWLRNCCNTKLSQTGSKHLISFWTLHSSALKMETECFYSMLVYSYKSARRYSIEHRHFHHRQNLKFLCRSAKSGFNKTYYTKPLSWNYFPLCMTRLIDFNIQKHEISRYQRNISFNAKSLYCDRMLLIVYPFLINITRSSEKN
jgi:hypothetical protein